MKCCLLAATLLATPVAAAWAQELRPLPWELRVDGGHERLDHGLPGWRELAAQVTYRPTARQALFAGQRGTERFEQRDREGFAGAYLPLPLTSALVHVEGGWSATHRVLARDWYLAEIVQPLQDGWVVSAGGKSSRYTNASARGAWATVERYSGNLRYAYQLQISRPEGASWSPSHRLTASWRPGELTFATLSVSRGREVENLPVGLVQSDVRAVSLSGGLDLDSRWGLVIELGWTRQGDLYTRRAARLGTRFLF